MRVDSTATITVAAIGTTLNSTLSFHMYDYTTAPSVAATTVSASAITVNSTLTSVTVLLPV